MSAADILSRVRSPMREGATGSAESLPRLKRTCAAGYSCSPSEDATLSGDENEVEMINRELRLHEPFFGQHEEKR
jgi:hypothetical protein